MLPGLIPGKVPKSGLQLLSPGHDITWLQEDQPIEPRDIPSLAKPMISIVVKKILVNGNDQAPASDRMVDDGGILPPSNTEVGSNVDVRFEGEAALKVMIPTTFVEENALFRHTIA
jgi:hypothetical protein